MGRSPPLSGEKRPIARSPAMSQMCSAKNRIGKRCGAWAVTGSKQCALHTDPDRAAEIGSKHGRKVTFASAPIDTSQRSLKTVGDVGELLEETINRVRQGPFDLRAANSIGFLAGILLKTLDHRVEERLAHLEAVFGRTRTETEAFDFRPKESTREKSSAASESD